MAFDRQSITDEPISKPRPRGPHEQIRELEAALEQARQLAAQANRRAQLAEERARETLALAAWGGRQRA